MNADTAAREPSETEQAVKVALAEFDGLRAEIVSRTGRQAALVGIGLTAVGVIVGFVAREDSDQRLLLAIPLVAAVVNLLHAGETYRIASIGRYIRTELWPFLRVRVGKELPSWEERVAERVRNEPPWRSLLIAGPGALMFVVASVAAMLAVDDVDFTLHLGGGILTLVATLAPASVSRSLQKRARD